MAFVKGRFPLKIENVVASAHLGSSIPLNILVGSGSMQYDPEQLPGVVYRIDRPESAAIIFAGGKIVCTGTKNENDARTALEKVIAKIKKAGITIREDYSIEIEEIIASAQLDENLSLKEISFSLEGSEYDTKIMPVLLFKTEKPAVSLMLFSSGRIVCAGAKSMEEISLAFEIIAKRLQSIGIKAKPVKE